MIDRCLLATRRLPRRHRPSLILGLPYLVVNHSLTSNDRSMRIDRPSTTNGTISHR
jgi:hypothetical protein